MGRTDLVFDDPKVKQMFRAYMEKFHPSRHTGSYKKNPMCLRYLLCYEISQELLSLHPSERVDYDRTTELLNNCPSYAWEKIIYKAVSDENHPLKLEEFLQQFMLEVKRSFEEDTNEYYALFKEELMKKLQQKWSQRDINSFKTPEIAFIPIHR